VAAGSWAFSRAQYDVVVQYCNFNHQKLLFKHISLNKKFRLYLPILEIVTPWSIKTEREKRERLSTGRSSLNRGNADAIDGGVVLSSRLFANQQT
jgi:hypothetical protein